RWCTGRGAIRAGTEPGRIAGAGICGGELMRVLVVAGARPNFMKVAPILRALKAGGHEGILVHTGQPYDARMPDAFLRDLERPEPDFHLGVGSGSHAIQTARV